MNNLVIVVLDSCRFDSFAAADTPNMLRLGPLEKRFSYCTWTAPSHYNMLMGLMPHESPPGVISSEYYKQDFAKYTERTGIPEVNFREMVPRIWLPEMLKRHGYATHARMSMPVLNPRTPINQDFDSFELMNRHNDITQAIRAITFRTGSPEFWIINTGETHYPYAIPDEPREDWPRISGVHGALRHLGDEGAGQALFTQQDLDSLRQRQIDAVSWVDTRIQELYAICTPDTWIIITSDHGELFGEGSYFGHGPIMHEKVFEVPFVEGLLPR